MKINVLSLFPETFQALETVGLISKAKNKGIINYTVINPRDFTHDRHRTVDDSPFGGGEGMVMKVQPLLRALQHILEPDIEPIIEKRLNSNKNQRTKPRVIFLSPQGRRFDQTKAQQLSREKEIVLICGRYEGVDNRFIENYVDEELSVGDFILSGGEFAALAIMESVFRCVPGVVGNELSIQNDSFSDGLLKYPVYTRPAQLENALVPDVLLSGNHKEILKWQEKNKLDVTIKKRPDLIKKKFNKLRSQITSRLNLALLHHPVYNKNQEVVTTSITNTDIHDIARVCKTYNLDGFFIVTPIEEQRKLINDIREHWITGYGGGYNPKRKQAIKLLQIAPDIDYVLKRLTKKYKKPPLTVTTSARFVDKTINFDYLKYQILSHDEPFLFIFGTGWGLTNEFISSMDYCLTPVKGVGEYNHLSVRSAVAIIVDRILGGFDG